MGTGCCNCWHCGTTPRSCRSFDMYLYPPRLHSFRYKYVMGCGSLGGCGWRVCNKRWKSLMAEHQYRDWGFPGLGTNWALLTSNPLAFQPSLPCSSLSSLSATYLLHRGAAQKSWLILEDLTTRDAHLTTHCSLMYSGSLTYIQPIRSQIPVHFSNQGGLPLFPWYISFLSNNLLSAVFIF